MRDLRSRIFTGETAFAELSDFRIPVPDGVPEIFDCVVKKRVGADEFPNLFDRVVRSDQLGGRRQIYTVRIRPDNRRRRGSEINFPGTRFSRHFHDLAAGIAADDGVVHQQHVFALEFQLDGVKLEVQAALPDLLARHDECPADVAVFGEGFAVADLQLIGEPRGGRAAGVGDRNYRIDLEARGFDLFGQSLTHTDSGFVDVHAVDGRVRSGQIYPFKNTRTQMTVPDLAGMQAVLAVNEYDFAGMDVADEFVFQRVKSGVLRCDHIFVFHPKSAPAELQRTDAVRIAKTDYPVRADKRDGRIRAFASAKDHFHRAEDMLGRQTARFLLAQSERENIEQNLRVGGRVQMTEILGPDFFRQLGGIRQVAVMRQRHAERGIYEERLGFEFARAAGGRVSHMADAHGALEPGQ